MSPPRSAGPCLSRELPAITAPELNYRMAAQQACGWPSFVEGTWVRCTNPDCRLFSPRARELQLLVMGYELREAIAALVKAVERLPR